jgi:type IV fimbrial biogenesis protein FimT
MYSPSGTQRLSSYCGGSRMPNRGFTLIELMIGLVLVSVLLTMGVPMYRDFILGQQLRATSTDLNIAVITARSEAVKRNRTVTLEPTGGDWGIGWTIPSPNGGEPDILNHVQAGDISITGPPDVEFSPSGRSELAAFQIDVGVETNNVLRCVRLGLDGRTTFEEGGC